MRRWLFPTAVLSGVLNSGCGTFIEIGARNLLHAPLDAASDCSRRAHLYELARTALGDFHAEHPDQPMSADYREGFKDGFVDRVESGGDGDAPPNPPWRYRLARYDTPGRQAQEDYENGFRQGSAIAWNSDLRTLVVIAPGQAPAPASHPDQRFQPDLGAARDDLIVPPPAVAHPTPTMDQGKALNPWSWKSP